MHKKPQPDDTPASQPQTSGASQPNIRPLEALLESVEDGDGMPFDPQQVSMDTCRALSEVRSAFDRAVCKRTGFTLAHFAQAFAGLTYRLVEPPRDER